MKKLLVFLCAIGLFMFGFVGIVQANLIENGDFQTGDLTGWDHVDDVTVSTGGGGNSIANFDVSGGLGDARLYQNFYVDPSWTGINVEFDFKLVSKVETESDFFKSFLRLEIPPFPDATPTVLFTKDNTDGWQHVSADILFGGLSIDPIDPNARLTFVLVEHIGDYSWAKLDNVSVAPIPEPATMLLLGTGLIGLGVFGRKKLFKK